MSAGWKIATVVAAVLGFISGIQADVLTAVFGALLYGGVVGVIGQWATKKKRERVARLP